MTNTKSKLIKIMEDAMTAANVLEQLEVPEGIVTKGEISLALDDAILAAQTAAGEAEIALEELT